jgi:citrate synthase
MLAPTGATAPLLDITDEEAREQLARARYGAVVRGAVRARHRRARGAADPIDQCSTITERFMTLAR